MFIKFNKITAHNFLSLGHVEFLLGDRGSVLVEGVNNNLTDYAHSNGSGKSSLFNAICWALTGETIQGISTGITNIFGTNDGCYVILDFELNNDVFKVTRLKDVNKIGNDLKIIKNNRDISGKGIRESTKVLETELGDLTSELIGSIIILGQGMPHKFSNNTPAGRKELLEKLSKSDFMIEDIKNRLSMRRDELSNQLENKKSCIVEEKAKLNIYTNYIADSETKLDELKDMDFSYDISFTNTALNACLDEQTLNQNKLIKLENELKEITDNLTTITNDRDSELNNIKNELDTKLSSLIDEQIKIDRELDDIEFKLNHIDNDICPTCGQKIPNKEHIDKQPFLDRKKELNELWNSVEDKINEFKSIYEKQKNSILLKYDTDAIITKITNNNIAKQNLQETLASINNNVIKISSKLSSLKAESAAYDKNIEQLQQTIVLNVARKQSTEEKIVYYNEEVEELSQHLGVVNQMLTIVKRDFRGYLLINVINYINNKANDYSEIVFGNKLIRFELDGNNINISYCDKPYENLSGGEKQKLDLIIQFALKDMLNKYLNIYCNILVLDEIFDNLDTIGCERILNLISSLNDVSSIYIISHHVGELQIPYDNKIIIEKDSSGISRLINAV